MGTRGHEPLWMGCSGGAGVGDLERCGGGVHRAGACTELAGGVFVCRGCARVCVCRGVTRTCVPLCARDVHVCVSACAWDVHVCLRAHGMRVPCVCAHRFLWGCAGAACARSARGGAHARAGSVRAPSQQCRDSPVSPRHPVSPRDRGASLGPRRMAQGGWSILGARGSRRAAGTEGPGPGMDGNVGTPPNPLPCPCHPGPSRVTVPGASPFPSARAPTHVAIVM